MAYFAFCDSITNSPITALHLGSCSWPRKASCDSVYPGPQFFKRILGAIPPNYNLLHIEILWFKFTRYSADFPLGMLPTRSFRRAPSGQPCEEASW